MGGKQSEKEINGKGGNYSRCGYVIAGIEIDSKGALTKEELVLEGAKDIPAAKEMVSEENAASLHEKFIGFINDFISSGKETAKAE
ncbi:MAG: hypothetical protein IJ583_03975 [Firmicutes bacterium]|nr:hypothetical protein [Bacillota bacterium]